MNRSLCVCVTDALHLVKWPNKAECAGYSGFLQVLTTNNDRFALELFEVESLSKYTHTQAS